MATSTTGARSRKRTATQGIQSDRADIAAAQKARAQRTRQGQKEIGSYRGATQMSINAVRQAANSRVARSLAGTPEGRQIAQETRGQIRALRGSLPFTIAGAQRSLKSDLQGINQDLMQSRLSLQQHQQDRLAAIQDILRAQQQNAADRLKSKATKSEIDLAVRKAVRLIREQGAINVDPNAKPEDKRPHAIPTSPLEWKEFEQAVAGGDVSNHAAIQAIRRIQRLLKGKHPDLFVNPPKYLQNLGG